MKRFQLPSIILGLLGVCGGGQNLHAQGTTAFAYQGQLMVSNNPATGDFDLTFTVFDNSNRAISITGGRGEDGFYDPAGGNGGSAALGGSGGRLVFYTDPDSSTSALGIDPGGGGGGGASPFVLPTVYLPGGTGGQGRVIVYW
jgi:hypothetical protein